MKLSNNTRTTSDVIYWVVRGVEKGRLLQMNTLTIGDSKTDRFNVLLPYLYSGESGKPYLSEIKQTTTGRNRECLL